MPSETVFPAAWRKPCKVYRSPSREAVCRTAIRMERRLGKIQARHRSVNDLYEVSLRDTAEGVRLFWQMKEDRKSWRESRAGAYVLRTNTDRLEFNR